MSDHPAQVSITLDGRPHTVPSGRSLAAALIATDRPVTRYDRAGRPRAPYCGMGVCFDCAVTVDGTPLVRACQEPVRSGMRVDTGRGVRAGTPDESDTDTRNENSTGTPDESDTDTRDESSTGTPDESDTDTRDESGHAAVMGARDDGDTKTRDETGRDARADTRGDARPEDV
ncbi:(2Fe-2S)-binding protein [Embleya sp. NPDC127516]|uniref:(2Fe-2S)-binding protein n=1 Tax=Embleya sp. NPDC127516 TaxID=3363990 RepID=UPI0037FE2144